jgi:hypothetical protein
MKVLNRQKGQTLIETAIILILLLLIVFGITEFARAWFTKNSLKNAARQGVRLAVVTPSSTAEACPLSAGQILCPASRVFTPCDDSAGTIENSICTLPGVSPATPADTQVSICYKDEPGGTSGAVNAGDTISVCVRTNFKTMVPGLFSKFIPSQLSVDASMRQEN